MMRKAMLFICVVASAIALSSVNGADFVVINTNPNGADSLYQAILDANQLPGPDRILFNIPGAGVHKIDVSNPALPILEESLSIDGYTQPGARPNSLAVGNNAVILIQLDGGATPGKPSRGLQLQRGVTPNGQQLLPANYTIRGLSLTGFVAGTQNNSISGGYAIGNVNAESAVVVGNFIGLLPDGETPRGNYGGVAAPVVGGIDPASRNVISGNTNYGVTGNLVRGNYLGTNAAGTKAVPNLIGVLLAGDHSNTIIGGPEPGAGNLVSGNTTGIRIGAFRPSQISPYAYPDADPGIGARIQGNLIGTAADGVARLPNEFSIRFLFGSNNTIGGLEPGTGNVIAFNRFGINVANPYYSFCAVCGTKPDPPSSGNRILSNSIYSNASLAIDLGTNGPTPDDSGDGDSGPNTFQNAPVIESAVTANDSVTIKGRLNSAANTEFTLQYFSESLDLARPVQTYLGSTSVTTDGDGNAQFSAAFPITDANISFNMTATSADGNTSEFSRNAAQLRNLSTRTLVAGGDNTPIAGFIARTGDQSGRTMVLRALGPSLLAGNGPFPGRLSDPTLEIYDAAGKLMATNDNWRESSSANYLMQLGLAPSDDREAALLTGFADGGFTAVVRSADGSAGIAVVEAYDISQSAGGEVANISTRGFVQPREGVMIAGFILEQSNGPTRIVARALGPSLAAAGVTNRLIDPMIELHDAQGALIASNDNWRDGQPDALTAVGLAPSNESESAIFVRVAPGAYTAIVTGKANSSGIALVEIYDLH
jgi:hypothetical protein